MGARLRRAALPLLLCLVSFGVPPALAYKAGEGADDMPAAIPEYTDAAAYLADASRTDHRNVKIGLYTLPRFQLEAFNDATGLTNSNLIQTYSNVAAYLADNGRTNRLYAAIGGNVYLVTVLETANNAGTLSDSSLPNPVAPGFSTTAVGDSARAKDYDATAIGASASATGSESTAVGQSSLASGTRSVALGDHARAYGGRSVAVGKSARAASDHTTAVGVDASSYGSGAISLGRNARALGETTMALGRGAVAAQLGANQDLDEVVPESHGLGSLIECAHDPGSWLNSGEGFVSECDQYLTADERADARLSQDNAAGRAFRQTIRQRLQTRLTVLSTSRATAVGAWSLAGADYATAVGQYAHATGDRSTALGSAAVASGDNSVALGRAAFVTGEDGTAAGHYANVHGDRGVALGKFAGAGGWVTEKHYANAAAYLADGERTSGGYPHVVIAGKVYRIADLEAVSGLSDTRLPAPVGDVSQVVAPTRIYRSVKGYLDDSDRTDYHQVIIAGKVYAVAALEAVSGLTEATLPTAIEGAPDAIAVGAGAQAPAEGAIAIGSGTEAVGRQAVVLGTDAAAFGSQAVAIGPEAAAVGGGSIAVGDRAFTDAAIEEYASVPAFLADPDRNNHEYVKVGNWIYPRWQLAYFAAETGLTDANLVRTYADLAAYNTATESDRKSSHFAVIDGELYVVSLLEAYKSAGAGGLLTADNLPYTLTQEPNPDSIAIGTRARAEGYRATAFGARANADGDSTTAIGRGAQASGRMSTAVGRSAQALGRSATALGARARAYSPDSVAVGQNSQAYGDDTLAAGRSAVGYGEDATSLGTRAVAMGERTTALGRGAVAANLGAGQTVSDAVPETWGLSELISCATSGWYAPDTSGSGVNLLNDCPQYLTDAEKGNADLIRDTAAGRTLRQAIRQRLEKRLAGLSTARATAVGAQSQALSEYATALGQFARAIEAHSTAIGARAIALGQGSIAIGSGASATGANAIAIGAGVSAGANEVVIGSASHTTYKLPGLAHSVPSPVALTIDSEGRLVVLMPSGAPPPPAPPVPKLTQSAGPKIAASKEPPKNPNGAGNGDGTMDGADPGGAREGEGSAPPALQGSNGGTGEGGGAVEGSGAPGQQPVTLRQSVAPGPAGADPATTERLDSLERTFNRSLGVLSERLDKATAMSSALTALPNVVPNGGRFYVGAGAGSYRGQQAIAIGISARGGSAGNVFFNAGAATTGGGSMSMRAGVGFVW